MAEVTAPHPAAQPAVVSVWRGEGHAQAIDQTAALYVYFIAPMWWLFDSAVEARDASKVLGTLALCSRRRDRLRAHRPLLIVTGALTVGLAIASQVAPSAAGDYASVLHAATPPADLILRKTGLELLELAAISGFVPVLLATAIGPSARLWRDDPTGPLLIVFWLAALATALQSGAYLASNPDIPTGVERYVAYAVPIALVLAIVLLHERQILPRWAFPLAALLALPLLAMPRRELIVIEAAVWSAAQRVHVLSGLGRPGSLAAGVAAVLATWLVARCLPSIGAVLAGAAMMLSVLAVQDQAADDLLLEGQPRGAAAGAHACSRRRSAPAASRGR